MQHPECRTAHLLWTTIWLLNLTAVNAEGPIVCESPRQIPVAYTADVLVVGGSTGAVSAAVAAAEAGAKVFLAAPRPYLGDDMVATLRLWWGAEEPLQTPLARKIFRDAEPSSNTPHPLRLPVTYQADRPSAPRHRDTDVPSRLADGVWGNPSADSVQYDGDVNLLLDLGQPQAISAIRVMAHHREDAEPRVNYKIDEISLFSSDNGSEWHQVTTTRRQQNERSFVLSIPVSARTQYLKLAVKKCADAGRILLSEIEVIGKTPNGGQPAPTAVRLLRPMHIKKTLDDALIDAGVSFLYGCYATDVLKDADGEPCGIVMANRAGRQAVVAKTIIDATDRTLVAELAGAQRRPWPATDHVVRRVVIGGDAPPDHDIARRVVARIQSYDVAEYRLNVKLADGGYRSLAEAEQHARDLTYQPGQVRASERLFFLRPDSIVGRQSTQSGAGRGESGSAGASAINACRPAGASRVYVLGQCADLPRAEAARLVNPPELMKLGSLIGEAAAAESQTLLSPNTPRLPAQEVPAEDGRAVREVLVGVRPTQDLPTVAAGARRLPVFGEYDVLVIGGGTSGAPAAIAAARQGARTLVVEYQEGLGGIGTIGLIGRYHRGNRVGFTAEVPVGGGEPRMEWWRHELRKAGGEIWLGTLGCGAVVEGNRVVGALIARPDGRGVVLAKVVIDATGNADIAIAAGAEPVVTDELDIAVQGAGLPARALGATYTNTDYALVDDADMVDVWRILIEAKRKYAASYDLATIVQTRERRRVAGDFVLTYLDHMVGRTYPDTIVRSTSNYDSHGYPSHPIFAVVRPDRGQRPEGGTVDTPYRCLLPRGLEGILVVGLGISAHRDAMALVRMQADLQNQGYAAGAAAAMAVEDGVPPRRIDIKRLQRHLVEIENLPSSVLTDTDSFPVSRERIELAVDRLTQDKPRSADVALILAHQSDALPLLRGAYAKALGEQRITYACLLGVCGDATGCDTLTSELVKEDAWEEKKPLGVMAEYSQLPTRTDAIILALGYARHRAALPALLKKAATLTADVCLSHHRAIALSLERLAAREAAPVLANVLQRPGMGGHAKTSLAEPAGRVEPLREIVLARALYRCGDRDGLAEGILRQYTQDLRGHLARHAAAILEQ